MPSMGPVIYMPQDPREKAIGQMATSFASAYKEKEDKKDLERAMKEMGEAGDRSAAFQVKPPSGVKSAQDMNAWQRMIDTRHPTVKPAQPKLVSVYDAEGKESQQWVMPGQSPGKGFTMGKPEDKREWYSGDFKPMGEAIDRPKGGLSLEEMKEQRARRTAAKTPAGGKASEKERVVSNWLDARGIKPTAKTKRIGYNVNFNMGRSDKLLQAEYFKKMPDGSFTFGDEGKKEKYREADRLRAKYIMEDMDPGPATRKAIKEANAMKFDAPKDESTTIQPAEQETGIGDSIMQALGMGSEGSGDVQPLPPVDQRKVGGQYKYPDGRTVMWDGKGLKLVEDK